MNDDDVNILAAGGARYVAGPSELGGWGGGGVGPGAVAPPKNYADIEEQPSNSKDLGLPPSRPPSPLNPYFKIFLRHCIAVARVGVKVNAYFSTKCNNEDDEGLFFK